MTRGSAIRVGAWPGGGSVEGEGPGRRAAGRAPMGPEEETAGKGRHMETSERARLGRWRGLGR